MQLRRRVAPKYPNARRLPGQQLRELVGDLPTRAESSIRRPDKGRFEQRKLEWCAAHQRNLARSEPRFRHLGEQSIGQRQSTGCGPDGTFTRRVAKGFDFLGYHFGQKGLMVAKQTLERIAERMAPLRFATSRPHQRLSRMIRNHPIGQHRAAQAEIRQAWGLVGFAT